MTFRLNAIITALCLLSCLPAAAFAQEQNLLPAGAGRDIVNAKCGLCHSVRNITAAGKQTAQFWRETVEEMYYEAGWDEDADQKVIINYLVTALGTDAPAAAGAVAAKPAPAAPAPAAAPPAAAAPRPAPAPAQAPPAAAAPVQGPEAAVGEPIPGHDRRIRGTVVDQQNLAVRGARVSITQRQGAFRYSAVSPADFFSVEALAPAVYDVRVQADGFAPWEGTADVRTAMTAALEARLVAAGVSEQVVVTPTRSEQSLANVAASVTVVTAEEIAQSPAVVADDVLRQVPTFSLFRRTSSLAANPTAQGVSLRGIGPSGVSRTLVLIDDVPFNDPFGGWVYWTRVPLMDTERIEIVDGATSSLYGNYAMGGVINIRTNRPTRRTLIFRPQYGNRRTPKMDLFASDVWGKVGVTMDATVLDTDGYLIVAPEERGRVDNEANVKFWNWSSKVEYDPTDRVHLFVRGGVFDEKRNNGKIGELNSVNWTHVNGGARAALADGSTVEGRVFFDREDFFQNTFAVPAAVPARSQSNLTLDKTVPTDALGTSLMWSRGYQFGGREHFISAGSDFRWMDGDSDELTYALATGLRPLIHRVAGGTQRFWGVFGQDLFEVSPKVQLTLSARVDSWRNYDAHFLETTLATGLPTAANRASLPDSSDTAVSPRVAALYRASDRVSVWGSVSRGFRAPTLKELYSSFRVGAILTQANEFLGPERLTGEELGVTFVPMGNLTVRGTWFNNRVNNPVANVTIAANGNTRQLQNLGSTNIAGFQTDASYRLHSNWSVSGAYVFDIAKVHESVVDAAGVDLTGKYLAQVPKHRGSMGVSFTDPKYATVAVEAQFVGRQFDDDRNLSVILPGVPDKREVGLPGYTVLDLSVIRAVDRHADIFFGVQNLFDTVYYVGTNPTTIGTPRLVNAGVRLKLGR